MKKEWAVFIGNRKISDHWTREQALEAKKALCMLADIRERRGGRGGWTL